MQAGLHSKVATFDRSIGFVGSFNLDPRSMRINTEVGVIVHDPGFASELAELLEYAMKPENSWRLELDDKRDIDWVAGQRLGHEPSAGFAKRFVVWFLSLLPVESQL
jgi:putative cardiolipin synthase